MKKTTTQSSFIRFKILKSLLVLLIIPILIFSSCKKGKTTPELPDPVIKGKDTLSIYIPNEFKALDFKNSASKWSYARSSQSEHFIIFWDLKYGTSHPNAQDVPSKYRVDIAELLKKAENFYQVNVNTLKFAEVGTGKSKLDKYKMLIFLYYQDEWLATGSGYDDTIGSLWISPQTVQPVGSVLAHEIGHCFQYQVFCDQGGQTGFRYGFGGKPNNGFWEQTAQWQSFQSYPAEAFTSYNFGVYMDNCHRHINHEGQRYASYFMHYYWAAKHGIDIVGRIWRGAVKPEDPNQAYMRLTGITTKQFNEEIYDAATKFVTWDLPSLKSLGADYIGKQPYDFDKLADGSFQVKYARCPGSTGYNVVPLKLPAAGTVINAQFTGLPNAAGYNQVDAARAGWRYGYVALLANGTRIYSNMFDGISGNANFTMPANCSKLWFVVAGTPTTYLQHGWDDDNTNDDQWPYKVKFTNTTLINDIVIDAGATPKDVTFDLDVKVPLDLDNYNRIEVKIDQEKLAQAFVLTPAKIIESLANKTIKFYGVESNGSLNVQTTANGYGHWFNATGNVIAWGNDAKVFSEMDGTTLNFALGQYPKHVAKGDKFTVSQALVYDYETNKKVKAIFKFMITIE
jgi:hypothetical protein